MFEKGAAYVGGRFVPYAEATIHVADWGFTRSDVTYDVVHVRGGAFFRLGDHLDRFAVSLRKWRLSPPEDRAAIEAILHRCVALTGLRDAYVSMACARGVPTVPGSRKLSDCANHLICYAVPWIDVLSPEIQARGAHVLVASTPRIPDASLDPTVKNYQRGDFTAGLMEAEDAGFDTAILCDAAGLVTEGPGFNVFVVHDGRVVTPRHGSLGGITRLSVLELCGMEGIPAAMEDIPRAILEEEAEEVFLATTAGGVMPVSRVGRRILGNDRPGPLSARLKDLYWRKHAEGWHATPVRYELAEAAELTRVLLSDVAAERHGDRIRAAVPEAVLLPVAPEGKLPDPAGAAIAFVSRDLFVGGTRHRLNPRFLRFVEFLKTAPDLRWVQTFSAGTDMVIYQEMLARGLLLSNSAGASAPAVAQTAVTGLLALARQLPRMADAQRRRAWEPLYALPEPRDIDGQHAVVLGTGPIGREIARLCRAFGLRTTGVRRDPADGLPEGFDAVAGYPALPDLMPTTDWLLLACPLSPLTRGIVDARALSLMPRGAHLIDVSRGGVVVEADLIDALRSGQLAGAFLDVFPMEPLPADSPFWELPNVIVSPHSAGASDGLPERVAAIFADNLARFVRGEAPRNLVRPNAPA